MPLEISDYDEMRNEASQYETLNTIFYVVQTPMLALSPCSLEVSKACAAYVMVRLTKGDHEFLEYIILSILTSDYSSLTIITSISI